MNRPSLSTVALGAAVIAMLALCALAIAVLVPWSLTAELAEAVRGHRMSVELAVSLVLRFIGGECIPFVVTWLLVRRGVPSWVATYRRWRSS